MLWEKFCPDGELLSEGVDRALEKSPLLVWLGIVLTALHLLNVLVGPLRHVDPYRYLGALS